ncbi:MAG: hypothetical protein AAGJ35_03870 [Myxococcota bacterium]
MNVLVPSTRANLAPIERSGVALCGSVVFAFVGVWSPYRLLFWSALFEERPYPYGMFWIGMCAVFIFWLRWGARRISYRNLLGISVLWACWIPLEWGITSLGGLDSYITVSQRVPYFLVICACWGFWLLLGGVWQPIRWLWIVWWQAKGDPKATWRHRDGLWLLVVGVGVFLPDVMALHLFLWFAACTLGTVLLWFRWHQRVLAVLWCVWGLVMGCSLGPWPVTLPGYEVLGVGRLEGERYSVVAKRGAEGVLDLRVISKSSMFYQSTHAYRYAEGMVHPAIALHTRKHKRVLLLGGEDGAILKELAKVSESSGGDVDVDWVPVSISWATAFRGMPGVQRSFATSWMQRHVMLWQGGLELLRKQVIKRKQQNGLDKGRGFGKGKRGSYDLIFLDVPGALVHEQKAFWRLPSFRHRLLRLLSDQGWLVVSAPSPYQQRFSYWCDVASWSQEHRAYVWPLHISPAALMDQGILLVSKRDRDLWRKRIKPRVPTFFLPSAFWLSDLARFPQDTQLWFRHKQACVKKH